MKNQEFSKIISVPASARACDHSFIVVMNGSLALADWLAVAGCSRLASRPAAQLAGLGWAAGLMGWAGLHE